MKGLYVKYEVRKKEDGSIVDGCFVLRPDRDEAARRALMTYAAVTPNQKLAEDITAWLSSLEGETDGICKQGKSV